MAHSVARQPRIREKKRNLYHTSDSIKIKPCRFVETHSSFLLVLNFIAETRRDVTNKRTSRRTNSNEVFQHSRGIKITWSKKDCIDSSNFIPSISLKCPRSRHRNSRLMPLTFTRIRIDDTDGQESEEGWREWCRHDFPCRAWSAHLYRRTFEAPIQSYHHLAGGDTCRSWGSIKRPLNRADMTYGFARMRATLGDSALPANETAARLSATTATYRLVQ